MDEKNLDLSNVQVDTMVDVVPSFVEKALPIAGGLVAGIGIGFLLDRFLVKPLAAKIKASKEAKTVVEEKKTEE